jgi:FkbM family methyltransferase
VTPVLVETLAGALYRHAWPVYRPLYFAFKRWQDATEIALVRRMVRRGDVVVDVGANVGFQTRLFAELVGPDGRVHAFEPDATNFRRLTAVVRGLPQVELARAALSDAPGTLTLYPSPRLNVDHRTYPVDDRVGTEHVPAVTLDGTLAPGTRVRFVKVDVQGDELRVLRGMRRVLDDSRDVCLLLECFPHGLATAGGSVDEFEAVLRAQGFRVHLVEGARVVEQRSLAHLRGAPAERYWNVVAARTDLPPTA